MGRPGSPLRKTGRKTHEIANWPMKSVHAVFAAATFGDSLRKEAQGIVPSSSVALPSRVLFPSRLTPTPYRVQRWPEPSASVRAGRTRIIGDGAGLQTGKRAASP